LLAAESKSEIHLLTYYRCCLKGFNPKNKNIQKLREKFRDVRFIHKEINVDGLFLDVARGNLLHDLKNHGLYIMALCAPCKISMHVRTAIYCLKNKINQVMDGANLEVRYDSFQRISGRSELERFYSKLGIKYSNPLCSSEKHFKRADYELYERGFTDIKDVKETVNDLQGSCCTVAVNDIYAMGFYEFFHSYDEFEGPTRSYFREKLDYYLPEILKYVQGSENRINGLIVREDA
jgi:hypothetical protein